MRDKRRRRRKEDGERGRKGGYEKSRKGKRWGLGSNEETGGYVKKRNKENGGERDTVGGRGVKEIYHCWEVWRQA